jgi:hypothetical protein
MTKPTPIEIDDFYKTWWLENYMTPLNRTPMGLVEFAEAFHDKYCSTQESSDCIKPGLTD